MGSKIVTDGTEGKLAESYRIPNRKVGVLTVIPGFQFSSLSGSQTDTGSRYSLQSALDLGVDLKYARTLTGSLDLLVYLGLKIRSFKAPSGYTLTGGLIPFYDSRLGAQYRITPRWSAALVFGLTAFEALSQAEGGVVALTETRPFNVGLQSRYELYASGNLAIAAEVGVCMPIGAGFGFFAKVEEGYALSDRQMLGGALRVSYTSVSATNSSQGLASIGILAQWTIRLGEEIKPEVEKAPPKKTGKVAPGPTLDEPIDTPEDKAKTSKKAPVKKAKGDDKAKGDPKASLTKKP